MSKTYSGDLTARVLKKKPPRECSDGHPIAGWNIILKDGRETCRVCQLEHQRRYANKANEKRRQSRSKGQYKGAQLPLQAILLEVLFDLHRRPKSCASPQDISESLGMDLNTTYVMLGRLHQFNFTTRQKSLKPHPDTGKAYFYTTYALNRDGHTLAASWKEFCSSLGPRITDRLRLKPRRRTT